MDQSVHREVKCLKGFGAGTGTSMYRAGKRYCWEKHHTLKGLFSPLMKSSLGQFF